ncbi:1-acyl-sn-glycerol-3-phosphate acyltransferase [Verrucomicrobiales bacterium]|nr:1-acyl-sn-glycerol-3-phosphate acyltransferase [Verrucomicrobiales bacterium]
MLEFSDLPYQFIPPKPNNFIIALGRIVNRFIGLKSRNHQLKGINVDGLTEFQKIAKEKDARFIILPNHPTHSDPQVINEVCRRMEKTPSFMAAYDVFARNKFASWFMQRIGAFSVDREGSDRKAMKCAAQILEEGQYPLVIFPEGNVYFCNDRVTPFAEGAAYIGLRTQHKLGVNTPVYAVPISLKYTFIEDVRESVISNLDEIAKKFSTSLSSEKPIIEEVTRISILTLSEFLQKHNYSLPDNNTNVDNLINNAVEPIIIKLEKEIGITVKKEQNLVSRIRTIRSKVHSIRIDLEKQKEHSHAADLADEAMLALRILGYSGGYATDNPSLDRIAETVARLREDIHSKGAPPVGKRKVLAKICSPIDLRQYVNPNEKVSKDTIIKLTEEFEKSVQDGINESNTKNDNHGSKVF